jgi:hypothetical protein
MTEEAQVRQPAPCQQAAMLQLLGDIVERLERIEKFIAKYEPMIARYSGWRRGPNARGGNY